MKASIFTISILLSLLIAGPWFFFVVAPLLLVTLIPVVFSDLFKKPTPSREEVPSKLKPGMTVKVGNFAHKRNQKMVRKRIVEKLVQNWPNEDAQYPKEDRDDSRTDEKSAS